MGVKVVTVSQPTPNGAFEQNLTETVVETAGARDAGLLVLTGADGLIDASLLPPTIDLPVPATEVSFDNPIYPTVEAALNFLLYVPIQVEIGNDQGSLELGSVVNEVTLSWTVNKAIVSQSLSGGVGTLPVAQRSSTMTFPTPGLQTNQTWTLTVSDGTRSATASTSVSFLAKAYWGVSASTTLTNAQILALSGQALASARARSMIYVCTGGVYPFFCYPTSFGLPSSLVVGGLQNSAYTVSTQTVTNAHGYAQPFYVIRFNNLQNASDVPAVWS